MNDTEKTKAQLIEELVELRRHIGDPRSGEGESRHIQRQEIHREVRHRLRDAVTQMQSSDDIQHVLAVLKEGLHALGIPFQDCGINLIDPDRDPAVVSLNSLGQEGEWKEPEQAWGQDLVIQFWKAGVPVYRRDLQMEDIYGEYEKYPEYFGHPVRCVLDIPFAYGTLAVNNEKPEAFSPDDIANLEHLTVVLEEGLRRWMDLQKLEQQNRKLEAEIAERQQVEEELRENEEKYRTLFETMEQGVVYQDARGRIISANPAAQRILGLTWDQMQGRTSIDPRWRAVQDDGSDFPGEMHPSMVALDTGRVVDGVVMGIFHPGQETYRWILINAVPQFRAGEDKPYQVYTTFTDITERKQTEDALRESEEKHRVILETNQEWIWQMNAEGIHTYSNAGIEKILGYSAEDIVGKNATVFMYPEDRREVEARLPQWIEDKKGWNHLVVRWQHKDGSIRWLESHAIALLDERGEWIGFQGSDRDITERKQTEEALRESERRFRELAELLPETIFEADLDVNLTFVNKGSLEQFGYTEQDFENGLNGLDMLIPEDRERARENLKRRIQGEDIGLMEYTALRKDGRRFPAMFQANSVYREGKLVGLRGFIIDITERKRMEEDLRRAHNLESLGLLAGGIAHDFNNVLTGVIGNLALLERLLDKDSTEYEIANEAQKAATKTKGLTQQLMTFAKGGTPVKEIASIEALIRETTNLSLHGANTRPEFHFPDGLSSVDIDTGQIGQVIQNLVINADQAMPNGGTLRIAAENIEIAAGDPLPLEPGAYVKVSIEDQGVGIPESILSQVFDPYFSTKESGHGLGLSITYSIIQRHSGHITVSSEIGVGTTFVFYLPASEKEAITVTETEQELARGTGRILLMDDEETIHRLVVRTLRELGYSMESAYDGEEALQMYKVALESGKPFDIVIMDLTIPGGMGGKEAVGKLREIDPQARVIVSSGYANDPVMANFSQYGFAGRVAKPVDIDELADVVKRILDE